MAAPPSSIAANIPKDLKRSDPHTFNPATDIPSQTGKVILITGANAGIGKQTALELAKHGPAQLWIAARNEASGKEAVEEIKKVAPKVDVRFVPCDLTSFDLVQGAAKTVLNGSEKLDVLILNAGIMGGKPGLTTEGYEKQFGTNHVGHVLLLKLLLPVLHRTAKSTEKPPRVIFTSSRGHKAALPPGGIVFDTLKSAQLDISGISKYTQSKLANVVYARQVAKHYPDIVTVAIHPEDVATQLFSKGAVGGESEVEYLAREIAPQVGVTVEEGAKNGLWAATAEDVESGRYYEPVGIVGNGSELSKDEEFGRKLWEWTQKELDGVEV
ncbi:NAD(P)-binding protein [Setomelanomma holmii]|uniref:NAD(P)-binding protein n=1 Tax=Setomelanomma holmii TaxID=210430 RepID=A0A9P4GZS7_9PLEO|nr:NAD(P)-binding protein [Setomelanomma holmii]